MTEEELEKRGEAVFKRFDFEDKRALKWFLTGQIQNILANEHGVGGSKGVRDQVRQRADERVTALINDDAFLEKLAERLAAARKINFAKLITDAAQKAAEEAIQKAAGYGASRVKVHVYIEPESADGDQASDFGKF